MSDSTKPIIADLHHPPQSLSIIIDSQILHYKLIGKPKHTLSSIQVQQRVHWPETSTGFQ